MPLNELELLHTKEGQLVRHLYPMVKTSHKLSFLPHFCSITTHICFGIMSLHNIIIVYFIQSFLNACCTRLILKVKYGNNSQSV